MKYLLALILLIPITSFSQTEQGEKVYDIAEVSPQYPGGPTKMSKFIQDNFKYPEIAQKLGEQGTIWVEFVVFNDGSLRDIKIVKGVSESLDDESIRVISLMPKWSPGEQDGKIVNVRYVIPIKATLDNGKKEKKKRKLFGRR